MTNRPDLAQMKPAETAVPTLGRYTQDSRNSTLFGGWGPRIGR